MVDAALALGLSGIAITDHDCVEGNIMARKYAAGRIEVIPGVELSAIEGHILCLGTIDLPDDLISKPFSRGSERPASELVDVIHDAGGIAIAAHPFDRFRRALGKLVYTLPFDAIEVVNGHTIANTGNPRKAAIERKLPMTGGSDAHTAAEVGNILLKCEGDLISAIKSGGIGIVSAPKLRIASTFLRSGILREYFKI
jgi:predicted metal-dependent phosphoesterase TrpH